MANPFVSGGRIRYVPDPVKTPFETEIPQTDEQAIRNLAHQRDLIIADLLEGDKNLDMLDAAIDDQMKDFKLPGDEATDAARSLCGSEHIDWECYKKAKELARIAPWIANGYDPVQTIFGGSTKREGPVIFDCKDYDPDTFFGQAGAYKESDPLASDNEDASQETFGEIQQRAQENQKEWALRILFWDFIWGKPEVKESFLQQQEESQESLEDLRLRVDELRAQGKNEEADKLAQLLSFQKLPDIIREGRPTKFNHLLWEAFPPFDGPLQDVTVNGQLWDTQFKQNASAIWVDPWSLLADEDRYRNKGIPVLKAGFLLGLLLGTLSLPPKVIGIVLKLRNKIVNKFRILKKIPIVGTSVFRAWKGVVSLFFVPYAYINNVFIDICIWLAMKPAGYTYDVGDIPADFEDLGDLKTTLDDRTKGGMDVLPTPAGFVPMDCLNNAQTIINKVHAHASE